MSTTSQWRRPLVLLLVLLILAVSCAPRKQPVREPLRIGYLPIAECLPLFVAQEQGLFRNHGVEATLVQFPGGAPAIQALDAGSVEVAFSNLVSVLFARYNGIQLSALWGSTVEDTAHVLHGLVVPGGPHRQLPPPGELIKRPIAVNTRRNIDELMLRGWFQAQGISDEPLQLVEVPFPRMLTVLQTKNAGAAAIVEPFLTDALQSNGAILVGRYFVDSYGTVTVTTYVTKSIDSPARLKTLRHFAEAMTEATALIAANDSLARTVLAKYTHIPDSLARATTLPRFESAVPSDAAIAFLVRAMARQGWIDSTRSERNTLPAVGQP